MEELLWRKCSDEFSILQKHDAVREKESFVEIVGHEQDGLLHAAHQVAEHVLHLGAG